MNGVICISHNRNSVLSRKSGKHNPESKVELENNLRAKHSILSAEDFNTSKCEENKHIRLTLI